MRRALGMPIMGAVLLSGCAGLTSSSSFEQTTDRGSLMESETATSPRDYHGRWATSTRSCGVPQKGKAQLNIMPESIGIARVRRVWFYSDYADIIAEMASLDAVKQRGDTFFMQLSLDGQKMRFSRSGDRHQRIYHRCHAK